jgi:short-subunit dehydrogenase
MIAERKNKNIVIVSVSSDIGLALADHWLGRGMRVTGTFRTPSEPVTRLEKKGVKTIFCDLADVKSVCALEDRITDPWDALILCPGTQEPVGPFLDCDFDRWSRSIHENFIEQIRIVHQLLPKRNRMAGAEPLVLFFAGGGTNNATVNYSAYTISKISLIKMCELLDAECPDVRFVILGPGWVKTKIHEATLQAGPSLAGTNYGRTVEKLDGDQCNPMGNVVECCDWVLSETREVVGGRNFSVVFDPWRDARMPKVLREEPDLFKLRRSGNQRFSFLTNSEKT